LAKTDPAEGAGYISYIFLFPFNKYNICQRWRS
jgi:hypothetical protein